MRTLDRRRGYLPTACTAVLALLLTGSTAAGTGAVAGGAARRPAQPAASVMDHSQHAWMAVPAAPAAPAALPATAPVVPGDAALRLEALLGQHTVLAADMMRGRVRGDEDFAQAANAALTKNTDSMTQLVDTLFGAQASSQFKTLWTGHVTALFNYSRGVADGDSGLRDQARSTLLAFEHNLAAFFVGASQGRLPQPAADAAVKMHVDQLLAQCDAYAKQDWASSMATYDEAFAHTFGMGRVLAGALLGPDAAAALKAPVWRLRSTLAQMLAEHVVVVVAATRAGVRNSADFPAAATALNDNTKDLTAAMTTLFGAQAGASFQSLWADHVDLVMAYVSGVVKQDAAKRDDATAKLGTFENKFAAFLSTATNAKLTAPDLAKALTMHDQMLLRHADAYAAKDFQKAHDIADSTYDQMFDLASQLADAFGVTVAARLPAGPPETGLGGMAAEVGRR